MRHKSCPFNSTLYQATSTFPHQRNSPLRKSASDNSYARENACGERHWKPPPSSSIFVFDLPKGTPSWTGADRWMFTPPECWAGWPQASPGSDLPGFLCLSSQHHVPSRATQPPDMVGSCPTSFPYTDNLKVNSMAEESEDNVVVQ